MPEVTTRTFDQILAEQARAAQASAARRGLDIALDFSVGSILRAIAEAVGAVALWLQALCLQVLALTRASTSNGADLDSWMADFALTRTPAVAAAGRVRLTRFTTGVRLVVRPGGTVKTQDGAWTYAVVADELDPRWSAEDGGFVLSESESELEVPVVATVAGAGGNVVAGAVTVLGGGLVGMDQVTNPAAFTGGSDGETDDAFRARFRAYLQSLSRATPTAIGFAVESVRADLQWNLVENEKPDGQPATAHFYVVVDDGTGSPSSDLLGQVAAAVEQYRPVGITYAVVGPVRFAADVTMFITTDPGEDHAAAVAAVQSALVAYINAIPLGEGLPYTRLAQVAYDADPRVRNVTGVTLNGGTADIAAAPRRAVRAGTISVS